MMEDLQAEKIEDENYGRSINSKRMKAKVEMYHCPHCGSLLKGNEKFCPDCGNKVNFNRR